MNNNDITAPDHVNPAGDPMVAISAASLRATIETLTRLEQFFRHHASHSTLTELRAFCAALGWHDVCGAQALLDDLGWHTLALRHDLDSADGTGAQPNDRP
jgi:hypothetical protein